jgi:two-component system CheB/CheR fusion protein
MEDFQKLETYLSLNRNVDLENTAADGALPEVISRRLKAVGAADCSEYIDRLEVDPDEYGQLFRLILPNKTVIQADVGLMQILEEHVFPIIDADQSFFRIWCIGCGTGEETYSLAATLADRMGHQPFRSRVKIFATDNRDDALANARLGTYELDKLSPMSEELINKCFTISGGTRATFSTELRRSLIFGKHDLLADAPISRLDLVLCRRMIPFFNLERQKKAVTRIKFALSTAGLLVTGAGEKLPQDRDLIIVAPRLYCKQAVQEQFDLSEQQSIFRSAEELDQMSRLEEAALDLTPVAQLIINRDGILVSANKKARTTFSVAPQDFGRPLQDLEISYRPVDLRSLIDRSVQDRQVVVATEIERNLPNGRTQTFDVYCTPIFDGPEELVGTSLQFAESTETHVLEEELMSLSHQLQTANEQLQSTHEELETINEELQSSNEELETTNEELQSTNEELETMNEELQCTNQELEIGNHEQSKLTERIAQSNRFMEAVFASIRPGLIALDDQFRVTMWNARSVDLWGLRTDEVQGKPFFDLDIGLPVAQLKSPLADFAKGTAPSTEIELTAVNRRGRSFNCKLRVTRTLGNKVPGLILLVEEVT